MPRRKYLRDLSRKDTKSREQNILSPLIRDGYKAGICRDVSTVVTESGGEIKNNSVTNFKNRPFHRSQSILCNFVKLIFWLIDRKALLLSQNVNLQITMRSVINNEHRTVPRSRFQ